MAPRCLTSPYCLLKLEYAHFLGIGKRVIPINQMVIFQTLAAGDQQILHHFYQGHGLPDPQIQTTQDVLERSHFLIRLSTHQTPRSSPRLATTPTCYS